METEKTKVITEEKAGVAVLVKFLALFGIIFAAPFFPNQVLTGPIVNAILFISVVILGIKGAALLALTPSLVALAVGSLPLVLLPMVPFIMAGNLIMIYTFNYLRFRNYWSGVISAGILKYLFLYSTSFIVINLVIKKQLASSISLMMSWPQLATAILGGIIAYFFLKSIKKI